MGSCFTRNNSNRMVLENPPEPQSPVQQEIVYVSLHDYPSFQSTELTMYVGESLTILSDDGDFVMVKSSSTGRESYIPSNYIAKVMHRWLFAGITRYKAEELLMLPNNNTGAFMIRNSETSTDHALSVLKRSNSLDPNPVKHYRISRLQNGWFYISPSLTFPSLCHLVDHYSESADGLCCRLTQPCFIKGLDSATEVISIPITVRRPTINWKEISRSVILRRKRTESGNSLVSEGLREAISSYLQMTEGNELTWDT